MTRVSGTAQTEHTPILSEALSRPPAVVLQSLLVSTGKTAWTHFQSR